MGRGRASLAIGVGLLIAVGRAHGVETGRQILDRARALEEGERRWSDRHQHLKLTISAPGGPDRTRELDLYEKKTPDQDPHQRQLLVFREPADVRGLAFLILLHRGQAAEQWLYQPVWKRVRQVVAKLRDEPFAGTDLSNKDLDVIAALPTWTAADADATLLGDDTVDGVPCHRIELLPKRTDVGYAKLVSYLGTADLVPRRLDFHDDGGLRKTLRQRDVRTVGTVPLGHRIEVDTPAANSRSVIEVTAVELDRGIDDARFAVDALERGGE